MSREGHDSRERPGAPKEAEGHLDLLPGVNEFLEDVCRGLGACPKTLPCKYLYDERGSRLFDEICELDEYYVTRTETRILEENADEMVGRLGPHCFLVEFGSGSSVKTQLLLDRLEEPAAYVPVDISRDHLLATTRDLRARYPRIPVLPVCADYTSEVRLPRIGAISGRRAMFFPGSTLGNFDPAAARAFLERIGRLLGKDGRLLLGVDLKKEPRILEQAYADSQGVTAEFNRNLLRRINRELGGTFDVETFGHVARWNEEMGRVEMHLASDRDQTVQVDGRSFRFDRGETIWTESSYKYTPGAFAELSRGAGFDVERVWTDRDELFSVQLLRVARVALAP